MSDHFVYNEREVDCTLLKRSLKLIIACMQDKKSTDFILGRKIVFDIEFKQKDEEEFLKWRR